MSCALLLLLIGVYNTRFSIQRVHDRGSQVADNDHKAVHAALTHILNDPLDDRNTGAVKADLVFAVIAHSCALTGT